MEKNMIASGGIMQVMCAPFECSIRESGRMLCIALYDHVLCACV